MSDIEVNLSLRGPTKLETKRSHQVREIEFQPKKIVCYAPPCRLGATNSMSISPSRFCWMTALSFPVRLLAISIRSVCQSVQ